MKTDFSDARICGAEARADDHPRLSRALQAVFDLMKDGEHRTLRDISTVTGQPEASVSAHLRAFRHPDNGAYLVERQRLAPGLFSYRLDVHRRNPVDNAYELQDLCQSMRLCLDYSDVAAAQRMATGILRRALVRLGHEPLVQLYDLVPKN